MCVQIYMVFACSIMDLDTMFVVYNIPTVGICRYVLASSFSAYVTPACMLTQHQQCDWLGLVTTKGAGHLAGQ